MINEKLDRITLDLATIKNLIDSDYFRDLEIRINNENKRNIELLQEIGKYKNVISQINKIIKNSDVDGVDEEGYDDSYYDMIYTYKIIEILKNNNLLKE